jgi:hypothetical protein
MNDFVASWVLFGRYPIHFNVLGKHALQSWHTPTKSLMTTIHGKHTCQRYKITLKTCLIVSKMRHWKLEIWALMTTYPDLERNLVQLPVPKVTTPRQVGTFWAPGIRDATWAKSKSHFAPENLLSCHCITHFLTLWVPGPPRAIVFCLPGPPEKFFNKVHKEWNK